MESMNPSSWEDTPVQVTEVTMNELDNLVREVADLRASYQAAKDASNKAHEKYEEATQKMIGLLKACNRASHTLPGVGMVRFASKESYRVPVDVEKKRALFKYIQEKYGVETLTEMLSIHAAKINSWANTEVESDPTLSIPGLEAPTTTETFYFNAKN